ncbi:hypothetical protein ACHHYP_01904 [Achlya hypogyna]|uniref:Uncharacterized protein n=1 Tax=Achlya hypogyna TaxID=1202772 RepID=A0A1V9Z894_ACHHY|nr:hypothetical protein ACHHYP_01904 [Achlya hypogyna]
MLAPHTIELPQVCFTSSQLSPASAIQLKKTSSTFSLMNHAPYNGRCKYKSGRCMNERTLKENGEPHTLCEDHRLLHNKNQRKSDTKRRRLRRAMRNEPRMATLTSSVASPTVHNSTDSVGDSDDAISSILCSSPDDDVEQEWWNELTIAPITWAHAPQPWTEEELHMLAVLLELPFTGHAASLL